ncbi:hypothetical protein HDU87_002130 [Geranomyces variabilis]|uniref:Uncharacterized protein n=1 Tax=Geranomyces variabilis TaxID=109894 RepID=A0AAD5TNV6_9FUNG|nr:hypothetical protein HDU87_002130 [Geranomyces variabilis]
MGYESRRTCCAIFFWIKTTLAILIAVAFMAYMSERVYTKHHDATKRKAAVPLNTPVEVVPVDDAGNAIGPAIPQDAVPPPAAAAPARRSYNTAITAARRALDAELSSFRRFDVAS